MEKKSILWHEAEQLLASYGLKLQKVRDGRYAVLLDNNEAIFFTSLSQIIRLFRYLKKEV